MPTREEMRSLAEDIVGSYVDRIAGIAELRETVKLERGESQSYLRELRGSRLAEGKKLRVDLAKSMAERKSEVASMLNNFGTELRELNSAHIAMSKELKADLAKNATDLKHEASELLHDFSQARTAMSKEMKADLAKGVSNRKREVSIMKRNVGALLRDFSAELKDIRSELAGGHDEWQILTATMQAQRVGVAVEVKPPEAAAAPADEITKEITEGETVEITPEIVDIRDRVFEYLANHPDGTRLVELEREFGLARIQIAKLLGNLIDENKVEKRELLYFAI